MGLLLNRVHLSGSVGENGQAVTNRVGNVLVGLMGFEPTAFRCELDAQTDLELQAHLSARTWAAPPLEDWAAMTIKKPTGGGVGWFNGCTLGAVTASLRA